MKLIYSLIIIIISILFLFLFYSRKVEFYFVKEVGVSDEELSHDYNIAIFSNAIELESCLKLEPLKTYTERGLIKLEDFDFENKDFVFSYGRELIKIEYNYYYALFVDKYYSLLRGSNRKMPVKAGYKNEERKQKIFIYTINKENKFRSVL